MVTHVEFFRRQYAAQTTANRLALPVCDSVPIDIDYDHLARSIHSLSCQSQPSYISGRLKGLFAKDFTTRIRGFEATNPYCQFMLKAMDIANLDLESFSYSFELQTSYDIAVPIHDVHTDGFIRPKHFTKDLATSNRVIRSVLANAFSTAQLPNHFLKRLRPPDYEEELFVAGLYACLRYGPDFKTYIGHAGLLSSDPKKRDVFCKHIEAIALEIKESPDFFIRPSPSRAITFTNGTVHALTCKRSVSDDPDARPRHRIMFDAMLRPMRKRKGEPAPT